MEVSVHRLSILLSFLCIAYVNNVHALSRTFFVNNLREKKYFFGYQPKTSQSYQSKTSQPKQKPPAWVDTLLYGSVEEGDRIRKKREQRIQEKRIQLWQESEKRRLMMKAKEQQQIAEHKRYVEDNKERLKKQKERLEQIEEFNKQQMTRKKEKK